ncbi:excisionase family DNA-binding protein [Ornithinimicrobium murale]|uniref:excisionase family DNA-binding protein n=1 Tax=Ornithinimicrobium murale TaxID=1050153 RepID=UPI000E0D4A83|nr:excisionase family DNA-binding protein [Ornithinimicrobium murale]
MNGLPPRLWTVDELADYLSVPKGYVYKLTSARRIGFLKLGKELRFTDKHIETYLDAIAGTNSAAAAPPLAVRRSGRPRKRSA